MKMVNRFYGALLVGLVMFVTNAMAVVTISSPGTYTQTYNDCVVVAANGVTLKGTTHQNCPDGVMVSGDRISNLTIDGANFIGPAIGMVYCDSCTNVVVKNSKWKDIRKKGSSRGQFVQFNNVQGGAITDNVGGNVVGSDPEDLISLYKSSGTAAKPMEVARNCMKSPLGAWKSESGSGIMSGDNGGSYQWIHDNVLINPGQVGIGVAGGTNIRIENNKVRGDLQPLSNVGMYVWNQSGQACNTITVSGNAVNWSSPTYGANHYWNQGNCGAVPGNNELGADLSTLDCPGTPPPAGDCSITWADTGQVATVLNGSSVTAYKSATVTAPAACASVAESRACSNGELSGTAANKACTVVPQSGGCKGTIAVDVAGKITGSCLP